MPIVSRLDIVERALDRFESGRLGLSRGESEAADSGREVVPDRLISIFLASPSGMDVSLTEVGALVTPRPSCCAFLKSSFFLSMASLNSSFRSLFWGPPVALSAAFPRRILFLSSSGAL